MVVTVTVNAAVPAPTPILPKIPSVSGGVEVNVTVVVIGPMLSSARPLARKTPPTVSSKSMMPSMSMSDNTTEPDPPESNVTCNAPAVGAYSAQAMTIKVDSAL